MMIAKRKTTLHKSKWARNISLNILGNNFDNDKVLIDLFSDNLTKGENLRKLMFLIVKKAKISLDNSNSIMQLTNTRLKDINRVIIGNFNINSLPIKFAQLQESS